PGRRGELHVRGDAFGIVREATLEVRVQRDIDRVGDLPEMLERLVSGDVSVGPTDRPRLSGARRRERLEAHPLESDRAPEIPRVRHHEAALGVEPAKRLDAFVLKAQFDSNYA